MQGVWATARSGRLALVGILVFVVILEVWWSQYSGSFAWNPIAKPKPLPKPSRPIGKFHFLIAASKPNKFFCRTLVSSTATRYGPPTIAGWHGAGKNDAGKSHLAKIGVVFKYLEGLPPSADDDLFLMVDGYDVYMQFGPDVLIERYHQLVAQEDARILQQLGPTDAERVAGPLGRHVFFGYDKGCFPPNQELAMCWAGSGPNHHDLVTFGPDTDRGDPRYSYPRWLNSGTIMGHVKEARDVYRATMKLIDDTYDPKHPDRERDQFYMGQLWGEQEYQRIVAQLHIDPKAPVQKGPSNAVVPVLLPGKSYNHHIALDYDGSLFQPWAANDHWVQWRRFDHHQFSFLVNENVSQSPHFRPWPFHMPGDSLAALHRIFTSTAPPADRAALGKDTNDLVRRSTFGSSHVTRTVFGIWHCTLMKNDLDKVWPRMWYYPAARVLVRSAIAWFRDGANAYAPVPVDGRLWYPANEYPADASPDDGGAWSDTSNERGTVAWLSYDSMCKDFDKDVFSPSDSDAQQKAKTDAITPGKREE